MKRKSVPGFILGLISGLSALGLSWFLFVIIALIAGISQGSLLANVLLGEVYVYILGGIVAIIGACFCFRHAKIGGIILFVSCLLALVLPITLLCISQKLEDAKILLILIIPSILSLIAGILGLKSKVIESNHEIGDNYE